MSCRFAIEPIGVYRVWMLIRKSISRDAKSVWSEFGLSSRRSRYSREGDECGVGWVGSLRDLRSTTESARTNYVSTRPHTPSPCGCALRDQSRYAQMGGSDVGP